jgi:hypothetical protein
MIREFIPEYNIRLGPTDFTGYIDPFKQAINQDIGANAMINSRPNT